MAAACPRTGGGEITVQHPPPTPAITVESPDSPTAKARKVKLTNHAHRAVDDPVQLARAARIVRAALARQRLTLGDLTPLPAPRDGSAA